MGTNAVIARPVGDGWKGNYHHWDGYPSGLGKTLWDLQHGDTFASLDEMLKTLIDDHPAGWSTINGADWTQEPGYWEYGIDHGPCGEHDWLSAENRSSDDVCGKPLKAHTVKKYNGTDRYFPLGHSYRVPEVQPPYCYCHGDRHEEPSKDGWLELEPCTEDTCIGTWIEWVYILSEEGMKILGSADGHHELVGFYRWDKDEPEWKIVESFFEER